MATLNPDFHDFIGLLEKHGVEYLMVGGYAVAAHGFPRYTGDIDFFIATTPPNAASLIRVFREFGFGDLGLAENDFLEPDFVVEIGREPRKIQVLTGIDGVDFNECHASRIVIELDGLQIPCISKDLLIRNKLASGRAKDLIDCAELRTLGDRGAP